MKAIKEKFTLRIRQLAETKGFTLVELLIVIALLGALAIGLIGALDPFEQLKKGTDTSTRNTVSEVHSAIIRYYALKGYMPWCIGDTSGKCTGAGLPSPDLTSAPQTLSAIAGTVLSASVETGELKSNFTTLQSAQLTKVFVSGGNQYAVVCFMPESKSFKSDKNTMFDPTGGQITGCTGSSTNCYWCVQ